VEKDHAKREQVFCTHRPTCLIGVPWVLPRWLSTAWPLRKQAIRGRRLIRLIRTLTGKRALVTAPHAHCAVLPGAGGSGAEVVILICNPPTRLLISCASIESKGAALCRPGRQCDPSCRRRSIDENGKTSCLDISGQNVVFAALALAWEILKLNMMTADPSTVRPCGVGVAGRIHTEQGWALASYYCSCLGRNACLIRYLTVVIRCPKSRCLRLLAGFGARTGPTATSPSI